jgi:hypothetical protein
MARYGTETKLKPEETIKQAEAYFGDKGLGLKVIQKEACCISLEGGGGHVSVTAIADKPKTKVELETREWDYQVRKFMEEIHS